MPGLAPSNNPDVAIAQEWSNQADVWLRRHGCRGFSCEDLQQAPAWSWLEAHPALHRRATALGGRYPRLARRIAKIAPTEDPLTRALHALGSLRLYELGKYPPLLEQVEADLAWLLGHRHESDGEIAWARPFDFCGKGVFVPMGRPAVSRIVHGGECFLRAFRCTGSETHLATARAAAEFLCHQVPRLPASGDGHCFGAATGDRRRIHGTNALVASFLLRVWAVTEEQGLLEAALPALRCVLSHQREDGTWPVGEWSAAEPFAGPPLERTEHRAMSLVLRSLYLGYRARPQDDLLQAIQHGYGAYQKMSTARAVPLADGRRFPVQGRAAAEAVLTLSVLSEQWGTARQEAIYALRYAHYFLRRHADGMPLHERRRFGGSLLEDDAELFAWWHWALAEYQAATRDLA